MRGIKMSEKKAIEIYDQPVELLNELKKRSSYMDRKIDRGIVNEKTGSSIGIRDNGDTVIAASTEAQYKLNHDSGSATEISYQSNTITNRKSITTDEIVINQHKLNPQLYELSDMKQLFDDPNKAIGNFTMMGTVLVKAWEPAFGRYVLIRRQVRVPMFSPKLNIPDAPEFLGLNTDVTKEVKEIHGEE
jgi:hypothetical protein